MLRRSGLGLILALGALSAEGAARRDYNPCFGLLVKSSASAPFDASPYLLNEKEMKRRISAVEKIRQKVAPRMELISKALTLKNYPHDYGGRTKTYESLYDKVVRKLTSGPSPRSVVSSSDISDLMGFRFVVDDPRDVDKVAGEIRRALGESDETPIRYMRMQAVNKKERGYRAQHLIGQTKEGERFEIQVRTRAMNLWAEWDHGIYKRSVGGGPLSAEERRFNDYSQEVVEYIKAIEDGVTPRPPRPSTKDVPMRYRFPWGQLRRAWH